MTLTIVLISHCKIDYSWQSKLSVNCGNAITSPSTQLRTISLDDVQGSKAARGLR